MAENNNLYSRTIGIARETIDELKKVSTPTRQETLQASLVTMLIVIFVAIVVALYDLLIGQLMGFFVT